MWFYPLIGLLVILAIIGATLGGGIFTIVLVPLAAIALISVVVYGVWARALEAGNSGDAGDATRRTETTLPHRERRPSGRVRTSPEGLVDARREQQ